ncbi:hypothetical protein G9P44_004554 [Scheffersomyces stipitis]|nr:hypothetical protein G9P44_004554 [Scheffersomyces stipitis]
MSHALNGRSGNSNTHQRKSQSGQSRSEVTRPKPATSLASTTKWVSQVRTLPSNPNSNDFLKLEYIDINLNNSRKLIANLNSLTKSTDSLINDIDLKVNGNLIQLNQVKKELDWLDDI